MLANIAEVRARGAETIIVARQGDQRCRELANELFEVPATKPLLTPILDTVPLQFLAYFIATVIATLNAWLLFQTFRGWLT